MDAKEQIQDWSMLYSKPISDTEYKEICDNLNGFFTVLKEWDDVERTSVENERNSNKRNLYLSH